MSPSNPVRFTTVRRGLAGSRGWGSCCRGIGAGNRDGCDVEQLDPVRRRSAPPARGAGEAATDVAPLPTLQPPSTDHPVPCGVLQGLEGVPAHCVLEAACATPRPSASRSRTLRRTPVGDSVFPTWPPGAGHQNHRRRRTRDTPAHCRRAATELDQFGVGGRGRSMRRIRRVFPAASSHACVALEWKEGGLSLYESTYECNSEC